MAATWTTEEPAEGSAAATGMMPAGLLAALTGTSSGTLERGLETAALTRRGGCGLSSPAVFGESAGIVADGGSASARFPVEELEEPAGLPGEGLAMLLSDLVVTSEEAPLAG